MKTRIDFLDNLRTFLILLVVVLHSGLVYEQVLENSWIVIDPNKCNSIGLIRMYLDLFIMFSIFFISGYFVRPSVKNKSTIQFIKSKSKRIMLPWIIAVFTLIPAYKFIFLYSRGLPQESWNTYFHFFQRTGSDLSIFSNNPTQNWLWFLPVLFVFQIIYLTLNKSKILNFNISLKTGILLAFLVGLVSSVTIALNGMTGWTHSFFFHFQNERLLIYFSSFSLGSLANKLQVFNQPNNKKLFLISNIVLSISIGLFTAIALNLFFNLINPDRNHFFISETIDRISYYFFAITSMFGFLHILLYTFKAYFNKTNGITKKLNRNSYYVYIIHTIILGLLAIILMKTTIPPFSKFILLATTTFILSNMIIYTILKLIQKTFKVISTITTMLVILICIFAFEGKPETTNEISENTQQTVSLHAAVISGNLEAIKQHIKNGTEIDDAEPSGGSSPLMSAIVFNKTEIAILLIKAGANVDFQNFEGSTPLHSAAFFCRTEIIEELLKAGADKSIKNKAGSTAYDSVSAPFEAVKGIYNYFEKVYAPLGFTIDYKQIKTTRPIIAEMLK